MGKGLMTQAFNRGSLKISQGMTGCMPKKLMQTVHEPTQHSLNKVKFGRDTLK